MCVGRSHKFAFLVPGGLQHRAYDILRMSRDTSLRYETLLVRASNKSKKVKIFFSEMLKTTYKHSNNDLLNSLSIV